MYPSRSYKSLTCAAILAGLLGAQAAVAATPLSAPSRAPLASSFPGPLWALVAPQGGTATVSNAHLFLNVPGGSNHDALLAANQAVRLVQPVGDYPFDVSIKIDSSVLATDANTSQGLMVVADDKDFFTFCVSTDGTNITLGAHAVNQGAVTTLFEHVGFSEYQNPLYLRLSRTASAYIAYYSVDGNVWTQAGSFHNSEVPTLVGPFASNYNANPARAVPVVMAVNWFNIF